MSLKQKTMRNSDTIACGRRHRKKQPEAGRQAGRAESSAHEDSMTVVVKTLSSPLTFGVIGCSCCSVVGHRSPHPGEESRKETSSTKSVGGDGCRRVRFGSVVAGRWHACVWCRHEHQIISEAATDPWKLCWLDANAGVWNPVVQQSLSTSI